ncbi:MAG TPA: hypothetical protein VE196_15080 [Pseudonocardiaceae bacterium]|nr:hypothetical protein [Pseudonocardiaceae bacterium]
MGIPAGRSPAAGIPALPPPSNRPDPPRACEEISVAQLSRGRFISQRERTTTARLPAPEQVKRVNVAVNSTMVAAITLVMTTEQVNLTETVRRLVGYGDFLYRAITERGEDALLRKDATTREVVILPLTNI